MPDTPPVAHLRETYDRATLSEADAPPEPLALLRAWLDDAIAAEVHEPNAMTLATVNADGRPTARMVLLKGVDARGLAFYTNLGSRKAQDLSARPYAALVFWWPPLERQIRVEGRVVRVPGHEADAYFASRPRGSRLGAWASPQSRTLPDRETLEARLKSVVAEFGEAEVPRPSFWGGFRLVPDRVEFWQGRPDRLHDRLEYVPDSEGWTVARLAP